MKKLLLVILFVGFGAHAAEKFEPETVYSVDKQNGSVTSHGQGEYLSVHNISITNPLNKPASLSKGCFVLFDNDGNRVAASGTELSLLQEYKAGENKTGKVFFRDTNANVYRLPFVKWSVSECKTNWVNP